MAGKVLEITDSNFESSILQADKPALVDFWATWCGPCRMIAPTVEALADELEGSAVVGKLDVDNNRETAVRFGIQSIPTLLIFKGGELVDKIVVDRAGNIVRMDLLSPFAYLKRLTDRVRREANSEGTERNENSGTEAAVPECSDCTASGGPEGIRTLDLYSAIVALSQLSYSPTSSRQNCT